MAATEAAAITRPMRPGESPRMRTKKRNDTAEATANAKLLPALATAVARSTRWPSTKASPTRICLHNPGRCAGAGRSGSRARIASSDSAETANVTDWMSSTPAPPSRPTSQPPSPGPATCPEARMVSSAELPASTRSRPTTEGT